MGLATNLAIFMFCLSFVFYLFGYQTVLTNMVTCFQNPDKPLISGACTFLSQNLYTVFNSQIVLIGVSIGIISAITYFGATTVFSVVGLVLFGLATWPMDLLGNSSLVPNEIRIFIGGFYIFGYIVAMISWLKIGGTP